MTKEALICIILLVLMYQIYIIYNKKSNNVIKQKKTKNIKINKQIYSPVDQPDIVQNNTTYQFIHPQLGKPNKMIPEGYLFLYANPNPWNSIVYNQELNVYTYMIKFSNISNINNFVKILDQWNSITNGIKFNNINNELFIETNNENSALTIINLLFNNINNDLTLETINKNNLIEISNNKINMYPSVKTKIIDQILESKIKIENEPTEIKLNHDEQLDYTEDLAKDVKSFNELEEQESNDGPNAYSNNMGSSVYSFI